MAVYVSAYQFAPIVGLPYGFILELCRTGRLPCLKHGKKWMIPRDDGIAWLKTLAAPDPTPKEPDRQMNSELRNPMKRRPRMIRTANPQTSAGTDFKEQLKELLQ